MAQLRVRNLTGVDLEHVQVTSLALGADPVDFGPVPAGATSAAREVPQLRRIAAIDARSTTGSYTLRPYDIVGEEVLPPGEYVYELRLTNDRLTLELRAEPG